MQDLNRSQLIGRLTQDPELRQTPTGQSVASFSIATNRTYKDAQGNQQNEVEYHNLVAWGKLAEIIQQYTKKGGLVFAEGRLKTRSWDDPSGNKKYKTEIVLENFRMLDSKNASGERPFQPLKETALNGGISQDHAEVEFDPFKKEEISIEEVPF